MRLSRWAVAAALLLPGAAVAAPPAPVTRTYAASAASFANPGRGFFTYTETHVGPGYVPLDAAALTAARVHEAHSLVYRIFYLEGYQAVDTIGAADLARISADFATARRAGVKLVVRFAYSADSDLDAPEARVLRHIAQLKPILTGNADILAAVQAGFVGRWGEWYYTQGFAADTTWAARGRVLRALLAATSATTPVQVRTPQIKRRLAPAVARVGVHDDCFLAGTDDYGTFTAADDRAWLAAQSRTALVGGETCDPSERSGWANASAELAAYHWTYLNPSFHAGVLDSWGAAGRAEASRRLGYRLRLLSLTQPAPGTVTIKITNDGYAAPLQNRPVHLILTTGTTRRTVTVPADLRTWQPGTTITLTARFPAPRAGTQLALSLPDPAPRLAANPAYAIRLANTGTWDAARGWNTLGALG
ncbi:DUF4832 domain-containing protein [Actinoplanes sp. RD1]|uniref:DUF4832 domain-containing protein n=1 Tax=Actinoplanes sp. RD1 TaxID=3064538 RepID=UPI002740734B|nr:DUF4832 domain-containing protein [Actinoplanes sp. RD1]